MVMWPRSLRLFAISHHSLQTDQVWSIITVCTHFSSCQAFLNSHHCLLFSKYSSATLKVLKNLSSFLQQQVFFYYCCGNPGNVGNQWPILSSRSNIVITSEQWYNSSHWGAARRTPLKVCTIWWILYPIWWGNGGELQKDQPITLN